MKRSTLLAAVLLACTPVLASAQIAVPPWPHVRSSAATLQRVAERRWDAALAADEAFMQALRTAVAAEIDARRARGEDVDELLAERDRLQEMQMSFNMQYLALQEQMQNENRRFTMISNIMKTRRDTARNSISNVR